MKRYNNHYNNNCNAS